jgi:hypothetical protein
MLSSASGVVGIFVHLGLITTTGVSLKIIYEICDAQGGTGGRDLIKIVDRTADACQWRSDTAKALHSRLGLDCQWRCPATVS